MPLNVHYGCGLCAPANWINFDSSPTLRLQKIPVIGRLIRKVNFPLNVKYGDIVKGLPEVENNSCDAVYCSHVLEHLSLNDFRIALQNSYSILKPGGIFRCVLPDLETYIQDYLKNKKVDPASASMHFMEASMLGIKNRPRTIRELIINQFGNSHHLWMWDKDSFQNELKSAGFTNVRECSFNDSDYSDFNSVESEGRFYAAISFEAIR